MAILAAINLASIGEMLLNILYVATGLGLVIFFHELGHFGVAKWCGVFVERFSIGFGPILLSKKWRDTEYALSAIPFGGYVKMLGQDDLDPSQLTSDQIAEDPRSYSNKSVGQRMAIISAGVIMNIGTGLLFFAFAFQLGVRTPPAVLGHVVVGMPAWEAGLQRGDKITRINSREVTDFLDITRGVALTADDITIDGIHRDQTTFTNLRITPAKPDDTLTRRMIGVAPTFSLKLIRPLEETGSAVVDGTPAATASPPFQSEDEIKRIAGIEVEDFAQLQNLLAEKRGETVKFEVAREGSDDLVAIEVEPNRFRTLGLVMDIDKITSIKRGSPADRADMQVGDKIANIKVGVTAQDVGSEINPLKLPDYFASLNGQDVTVNVIRELAGGKHEIEEILLTPENRPGWIERPLREGVAISVPSIGIAFQVASTVLKVQKDSPAAKAGIQPGDRLKKIDLILPEDKPLDGLSSGPDKRVFSIELDSKKKNWAYAFWMLQSAPNRTVELTVSSGGKERTAVKVVPSRESDPEWFVPTRGIRLYTLQDTTTGDSFAESIAMGASYTRNTMVDIYLTLRGLLSGNLSYKELHGPIGIAKIAYDVAGIGIAQLLLFLGMISMNLAVLNFLPIPVLDGGHMVFLCWEAVTRKRPSERVLIAATYCGMAFVLGLMLLVIYLDIFRYV